jgi:hypothetical protein
MEVSKIENGIKLKSKSAIFSIHSQVPKTNSIADAILYFNKAETMQDQLNGALVIAGPGEYEIKSIKLTGLGNSDGFCYTGKIDGINILIAKASLLSKTKDMQQDCQIAIIDADILLLESIVAVLNANILILYGTHAQESTKLLGKEIASVTKFVTTREKLPSEMEIVLLS